MAKSTTARICLLKKWSFKTKSANIFMELLVFLTANAVKMLRHKVVSGWEQVMTANSQSLSGSKGWRAIL